MLEQLTNESTYESIFDSIIDINKKKINKLKKNIDINEILGLLNKSYTRMKDYTNNINDILNLINGYDIHPYILQPLLVNILYGCYLNNKDNTIYYIQVDMDLIFASFCNIFKEIDEEFKLTEDFIGYHRISKMNDKELDTLINTLMISYYSSDEILLDDNICKINLMIVQIERIVHENINILLESFEIPNSIENKLEYDLKLFNELKVYYDKFVLTTYNKIKNINPIYKNINIDILKFVNKNLIYYWLDHINKINNKFLKK